MNKQKEIILTTLNSRFSHSSLSLRYLFANLKELKDEANKFKAQIEETKNSLMAETKIDLGLDDILKDDLNTTSSQEKEVKQIKEKFAKVNEEKAIKKEETQAKFTLNKNEEEK